MDVTGQIIMAVLTIALLVAIGYKGAYKNLPLYFQLTVKDLGSWQAWKRNKWVQHFFLGVAMGTGEWFLLRNTFAGFMVMWKVFFLFFIGYLSVWLFEGLQGFISKMIGGKSEAVENKSGTVARWKDVILTTAVLWITITILMIWKN